MLWDMDGTLVDTEPRWGESTYAMAAAMGRELTPGLRARTVGGSAEATVRLCADWAGLELTDADVTWWIDRLYDDVSARFDRGLELQPGVPDLLQAGKEAGIPMMVVTNTFRRLTDRALAGIGAHWFVGSVCGDEVPAGKPDPAPYRTAADLLGVAPDDCIVFEDSANGLAAATAAGCRVVDVTVPGGLTGLTLPDVVRIWDARAGVTE